MSIKRQLVDRKSPADLMNSYGSTEIGGVLWSSSNLDDDEVRMKSVGRFTDTEGFQFKDSVQQEITYTLPNRL